MNRFGNVDSKFRFVILASKRAKQLLRGAKPKVKAKTKNPIRIAQSEVRAGVIEYEILPMSKDEIIEQDDRIFVGGEGIHDEVGEVEEETPEKDLLPLDTGAVDEVVDDHDDQDDDEESEADDEGPGDSDEDKDN